VGALALVVPSHRLQLLNLDRLVESVKEAAARTSSRARAIIEG
jgi:hypothetical protein